MDLAVDGSVGGSLLFKHDSLSSGLSSDSRTNANPGIVLWVYSPSGEEAETGQELAG